MSTDDQIVGLKAEAGLGRLGAQRIQPGLPSPGYEPDHLMVGLCEG